MRVEAGRASFDQLSDDLEASRAAERQSRREALVDTLTGLANRRQIELWLGDALADAEARVGRMALLFLDLDAFKTVNDAQRHAVGDAALCRVAGILRDTVPPGWRVARIAGDEFLALATDLDDGDAATTSVARALLAAIAQPLVLVPGLVMPLSISIGGAVFDRATIDRSEWLRRADRAMYAAKASGDHQFRMYRNQPEAAAAS